MVDDKMDVEEYLIKPQATTPAQDSSKWPLLLKNYTNLLVRTGHFTPIPNGSNPLRRDIKSYVSSGVINLVSFLRSWPRAPSIKMWISSSGSIALGVVGTGS